MYCMKCGRETSQEHVFCDDCLQVMDRYPVRPDVAVHLPKRDAAHDQTKRRVRRRTLPPEEQVLLLRKAIRRLLATIVLLAIALGAVTVLLFYKLLQPEAQLPRDAGRNYTISQEQP